MLQCSLPESRIAMLQFGGKKLGYSQITNYISGWLEVLWLAQKHNARPQPSLEPRLSVEEIYTLTIRRLRLIIIHVAFKYIIFRFSTL